MAAKKSTKAKAREKPSAKAAVKKPARKRTATRTPAKKKAATPSKTAKKPAKKRTSRVSLGRPRVTGDARLDDLFRKDYQARELFEFLGVRTVRELEAFGPDEIVERLTAPVVQTVGRIRKGLAMMNRCLAGDGTFAADFKQALQDIR